MIIFKQAADINGFITGEKAKGHSIGFVPTMGALHKGHTSLLDISVKQNDVTVSSIFVNPTQFNNAGDFAKYPSTIDRDIEMLENAGCDVLFLPSVSEIYPNGTQLQQHYNLGYLETVLEGKYRPGHFQGVCQVVHRLLKIVNTDVLYLGQKDYQQCMVIQKLIDLFEMNIKLIICPTLREGDGLAMSSRNLRLSEEERMKAINIFETLSFIKKEIKAGNLDKLKENAFKKLTDAGFKVDYVEIADAGNLKLQHDWNGKTKLVTLAAAYLNEVRLIDNIVLDF